MRIVVYGEPGAQGSKRFVRTTAAGKGIMVESSAKVAPWRQDVKQAAEAVLAELGRPSVFQGPVAVRMVFSFLRPKSVSRSKRPYPSVTPDVSKLARSTEDALTSAGVWRDDCLVVEYTRLAKVYCGEDPEALDRPGVVIIIGELVDLEQLEGSPPGRRNLHGTASARNGPGDQHPRPD
jgi:Holliday junction resolvase RusA-like endonuclease